MADRETKSGILGFWTERGTKMALSDREKRLLADMEAQLSADDPKLHSMLGKHSSRRSVNTVILGLVLALVGMATILGGVIAKMPAVGILGFIVALYGIILSRSILDLFADGFTLASSQTSGAQSSGRQSFRSKLEERWDKRNFDSE